MKLDFYGTKAPPPTKSIARAFGASEEPVLLKGGQGTTYRAGDIILKPSEGEVRENWVSEIFHNLPEGAEVRFSRPIRSSSSAWVFEGYVAWSFLPGEHTKGQYKKKLHASRKFHDLLKDIQKPLNIETPSSSWSTADLVVWQKQKLDYDPEFMALIHQITPYLKEIGVQDQLIHGDLSGNFLMCDGLSPAIIDFSPAWAPDGFAEGIMLADAITWENANLNELEAFKEIPNIDQFAWRGAFRRIAEQAEHIKWFEKDKEQAIEEARAFQKAIDYLTANF